MIVDEMPVSTHKTRKRPDDRKRNQQTRNNGNYHQRSKKKTRTQTHSKIQQNRSSIHPKTMPLLRNNSLLGVIKMKCPICNGKMQRKKGTG